MKGNIMDTFDKGWFVLQTYSGYENKVKENLLQRAQTYNMLDNILRVEIPTQTVQVEKNGKKKEVEENRFPGYVLVEMVMTDEAWFVVRNTPNVTGFVGSHGNRSKPTPLLEQEIRDILVSMGQTVQEFDIDVEVGQTVRIIDGAFADYTGKITEIDNNKVKMIISMFGNDTIAEVNLNQIAELYPQRGFASLFMCRWGRKKYRIEEVDPVARAFC
jgi:transcription termination/antitermination factor nusG